MNKKHRLNVVEYPENAAKNFTYKRLILYIVISLVLSILLVISVFKEQYKNSAMIFTTIAFMLISGYTVLNILALIKKIQRKKNKRYYK